MDDVQEQRDELPSVEVRYDGLILEQVRRVMIALQSSSWEVFGPAVQSLHDLLSPYLPERYDKELTGLNKEFYTLGLRVNKRKRRDVHEHNYLFYSSWFRMLMRYAKEKGLLPQEERREDKSQRRLYS